METAAPLFSVIIPNYNRAGLLQKCLKSLVDQTFKNFEVLVCDDGSTDNSEEIALRFKNELRLLFLPDTNWGGPALPRNRGIAAASAPWLCFLDSDDYWHPSKLEEVIPYLENYDLIYHDMFLVFETGKSFRKSIKGRFLNADNPHLDLLLNGNACINSSVVVRKKIIEKVGFIAEDKALISVEDFDYWLRVFKITNRAKYLQKKLGYYLKGSTSISFQEKHITAIDKVYEKHLTNINSVSLQKEVLCRKAFLQGRILQKLRQNKKAFYKYLHSIKSKSLKIKLLSLAFVFISGVLFFFSSSFKFRNKEKHNHSAIK